MITSLMFRSLLSLGLHASLVCQCGPFRNLRRDIGSEISRTAADYLSALLAQLVVDLRQRERCNRGIVQARQDRCWCAGRREQSVRIIRDQRRETSLSSGRDVSHDGTAPRASDRERAQRASTYMRL